MGHVFLLGCVIFFPRLAHVVNRGIRRGAEPNLRCADCIVGGVTGGLMGAKAPWFLKVEQKIWWSLEKRPCYGIKGLDILERRAFEYFMVKIW